MLQRLQIKLKTPTPPSSLNSNQSFYLGQTPANLYQLNKQKRQLQDLQSQDLSSLIAGEVLEKFIKRTEVAMQNAVLLQQEVHQLRASEKRQKEKKKASRYFIQDGGSLTGYEGQQKAVQREELEAASIPLPAKQKRSPRYSNCGKEGHNRLKCPVISTS